MEKYLHHYAEPETAALDGLMDELPGQAAWTNVVVIPACNEAPRFLRPAPPCSGRSLMILVINESVSAPRRVSLSNQALATGVQARFVLQWQSGPDFPGFGLSLLRDPLYPRDVLLVDRFSEGRKLPAKSGVGHARKIGADLAAGLIYRQRVHSAWIHCTDADVQLPETYFTCSDAVYKPVYTSTHRPTHRPWQQTGADYAALIYPFHHCDDQRNAENKKVVLATQLYELSLRYYVAGMKFAGSPYAFHTIGSTMAVNAMHYTKVRGFPKREAGEDFYLLNKLAKLAPVLELGAGPDCEPIKIEARLSDRVPFGTGAAVDKIVALTDPLEAFGFYHPMVFELLQLWLQSLPAICQAGSTELSARIFQDQTRDADQYSERQSLLAALNDMGTRQALDHAFRQSKTPDQFMRQMHTWFDAFRTLKLIHALRDQQLPTVRYATLKANQSFLKILAQDPDLQKFLDHQNRI